MDAQRWVYCRCCDQTYAADRGQRCSLCGKTGGLRDMPRPPPAPDDPDRASWAPSAGTDGGAAGCVGMLVGAALGVFLALGLPADDVAAPPRGGTAGEACGIGIAIVGLWELAIRLVLGVTIGGIGGGLAILAVLALLRKSMENKRGRESN